MRFALALAVPFVAAAPAYAQLRPFTVGVTGGTLGVGPEASYALNPLVSVRASATFLGGSASVRSDGFRYRGHAKISNWGGTVDVHPLASGFRLSAGVRVTRDNRIDYTARAVRTMTYGGVPFTPDQIGTLSGTIRANKVSPLLTAGWAHSGLTGLTLGIDAGVMFHGTPLPRDFGVTGELATNPAARPEYARQQQAVRDHVDGYRYYPVVQVSVGFRF